MAIEEIDADYDSLRHLYIIIEANGRIRLVQPMSTLCYNLEKITLEILWNTSCSVMYVFLCFTTSFHLLQYITVTLYHMK